MSDEQCYGLHERLEHSNSTWEEEIKRLKHDIQRTESKIIMTEKRRKLFNCTPVELDNSEPDIESIDPYRLGNVERVITGRQLVPEERIRTAEWVSPVRKRPMVNERLEVAVPVPETSPKRIRPSTTDQEWISPHRVIDHPNPEKSHGDWVTMSRRSPSSVDIPERPIRPFSQSTYTVRRNVFTPDSARTEDPMPVRKTAILADFEPETLSKKREGSHVAAYHTIANDNVRRIVHPDGRVVKVSTLGEFSSGILSSKNEAETVDRMVRTGEPLKRTTLKKMVLNDIEDTLSPPRKPRSVKRSSDSKKPGISDPKKEEDQNNKENRPRNGKVKDDAENEDADDVVAELKKILNDRKDKEEALSKRKPSTEKKFENVKKPKTAEEEKKPEPTKKKRDIDPKAVQRYIKLQKMKRLEQLKVEREKKATEEESKKKKLEDLRIRTLQLAATSRRKPQAMVQAQPGIKVVDEEAETEGDITMSLGLKQTKPRVSYIESISNLKRKTPATPESKKQEPPPLEPEEKETFPTMENLPPPENLEHPKADLKKATNLTLMNLAKTLQISMEKKRALYPAIKSYRNVSAGTSDKELTLVNDKKLITVDADTIKALKRDIKKISENFQVLHEIITDRAQSSHDLNPEPILSARVSQLSLTSRFLPKPTEPSDGFPSWLRNVIPRPHPYTVLTAVRNKMNMNRMTPTCSEPTNSKYDSDSESLTTNQQTSTEVKTGLSSSEDNYYSQREDSGSDFSSSILDSEKDRFLSGKEDLTKPPDCLRVEKETSRSTSMSLDTVSLGSKASSDRKDLILRPPDIQLISQRVSSCEREEAKSEPFITEIEDGDVTKTSSSKVDGAVTRVNDACVPRSYFNPEALHLQFQAELTLLETFQRSLAHFLEVERIRALSNARMDKAVNTEGPDPQQLETPECDTVESVKTELEAEESSESVEADVQESTERKSSEPTTVRKSSEKISLNDSPTGISFQMLDRMMKDEELRSEHQLALIRLREKTLNEKVKAEMTLLEMRKKALKERGGDEELAISAIKKRQRGILLKYQSEKEDIERLKKMHRIASEERKIMIQQQKQIWKMQLSTKDMLIKLKKRERSPQKRTPVKPKASNCYDSFSEMPEDISVNLSDHFTESITSLDESMNHSSDLDVTSKSNVSDGDDEILKRNMKALEEKMSKEKLASAKMPTITDRKQLKRVHSVDELMKWTKRLEEKENRLTELEEKETGMKHRAAMTFRDVKKSVRDRSTSPFQFQEPRSSPSLTEDIEVKKSPSIAELIESDSRGSNATGTNASPDKQATTASDYIPEEFSKKSAAASRLTEYNSESFESPSFSDTLKSKSAGPKSNCFDQNAHNDITIKMALSPRVNSSRRRYSSGSDESINLFHTETASEQSDVEIRIAALHEQLRCRKLEAERLRREQKRAHRERLKLKEQSLLKQIEAYDSYIQKKKQELEQEYERPTKNFVKPIIKQTKTVKRSDAAEDVGWQTRIALKKKEQKSESEIVESIKLPSEETKKDSESTIASEILSESSSILESLPKQAAASDSSRSESEEQTVSNVSIETTVVSPEKVENTVTESEDLPSTKESVPEEQNYSDSFESTEKTPEEQNEEKAEEVEEEVPEDVEESIPEEGNAKLVDFITESVLDRLLSESVNVMTGSRSRDVELLTNLIAAEIVADVIDDAMAIYSRKKKDEGKTSDVRRRIHEIMSQAPGTRRQQRRPQELMVTTYDLPPGVAVDEDVELSSPEREQFLQSLSPTCQEKSFKDDASNLDAGTQQPEADAFGQEWFDDDFGLSRTRREAEELRLQQLQIEQEIQQLQAQQNQVPYYYLRQIPNKPPPPYTPPGTATVEKFTSETEITSVTSSAVRILTDGMNTGRDISEIQPPVAFFSPADSEHVRCFKVFLFDLAKHIISGLVRVEFQENRLPWMRTNEKLSNCRLRRIEKTFDCLFEMVMNQVLILFGFRQKIGKERLIVTWSRKKRDHVDELLVGESQDEEAEWTHYDEDEVTVKNNVAMGILDSLLDETAQLINSIWTKKLRVSFRSDQK